MLDTALRAAAVDRGVHVRLLVSCWLNTDPSMFPYLRSLQALSNPAAHVSVDVVSTCSWDQAGWGQVALLPPDTPLLPKKVFIVPVRNHSNIPFSRVSHSKFMVTERAAYIGGWGQPAGVGSGLVAWGPGVSDGGHGSGCDRGSSPHRLDASPGVGQAQVLKGTLLLCVAQWGQGLWWGSKTGPAARCHLAPWGTQEI